MASTRLGGNRILDLSIGTNDIAAAAIVDTKLAASAKQAVLQSKTVIVPVQILNQSVNGGSATIEVGTLDTSDGTTSGIVKTATETVKSKANVTIVDSLGNPIMSNGTEVFGRVTAFTDVDPDPNTVTITFYEGDQQVASPTAYSFSGATTVSVAIPARKNLYELGEKDLSGGFALLGEVARDAETVEDISELYTKTGIIEGSANDYTSTNYITDGDTLIAALNKLDTRAKTNADAIASNTTNISTNTSSIGTINGELGFIRSFVGKSGAGTETPTYSTTNYVTQSGTLEAAIGELDAALATIAAASNDASEINYVNTTSGLTATTVQAAIDELDGKIDTLNAADTVSGSVLKLIKDNAQNATYTNTTSGLTATTVKGALDEIEGRVDTLEANVAGGEYIDTSVSGAGTGTLTGSVNGSNTIFTLNATPGDASRAKVFASGILLLGAGNDYTLSGTTLTFSEAPANGEILQVMYRA